MEMVLPGVAADCTFQVPEKVIQLLWVISCVSVFFFFFFCIFILRFALESDSYGDRDG